MQKLNQGGYNVETEEGEAFASEASLSRFFFALGHVALQHLVHVEETASSIRKERLHAEKRAAEAQAEGTLALSFSSS